MPPNGTEPTLPPGAHERVKNDATREREAAYVGARVTPMIQRRVSIVQVSCIPCELSSKCGCCFLQLGALLGV